MYYVGIHLGGISITCGVVSEEGEVIISGAVPTLKYRGFQAIVKDMADLCKKVVSNAGLDLRKDIKSIGIGVIGTTDSKRGVICYSSYMDLNDIPIRDEFKKYIDLPVYIENDSNCFALAESKFGAAKGAKTSVTVIIGYAIGGGIIVNGESIYSGAFHGAGEVGHHVIVYGGEACSCGRHGCWEAYVSVAALVREARIQAIRHPESEMFKMVNGDLRRMSYKIPFEAVKTGDIWAKEIVSTYTNMVALGLINIINILQPNIIVIGGRMAEQGEFFIEPVRELVSEKFYGNHKNRHMKITQIKLAELGDSAAVIGAAMVSKCAIK